MNPVSLQRIRRDNDLIRRMSLACVAGGLTVLSLPPFSWLIAVPVAFSALFLVLRNISTWRAFLVGWAFGVGQFGLGVSWIAESFYVDAARFGALALPAVAGLSAGLAVFPAIATVLFAVVVQRRPVGGIVVCLLLASCWVAAEWLRGHVLTGFPWNLAGYALVDYASLRQPAAWIGSYGLSFLAVLVGTLPGAVFSSHPQRRPLILIMGGLIGIGIAGAGAIRLETEAPAPTGVDLRIVQGNVPQREKWSPGNRDATVDRYLELSSRPGSVDLLLWPETAFPGFLDEDTAVRDRIATALPDGRLLLTGAPDRVESENGTSYFNTVQAYDGTGQILTGYAKHHLVPFGEYVPYRRWLPIARLTEGLGDFTPGPGPRTLALPGAPLVAVAICYEIIFPGHVVDRLFRPDWIFNATNDAWFGTSIGPEQHLASARMRAVEEGLPVVRAANTGISAVIDANGDVVARLNTGETGIIDASLPGTRAPTLYARFGDWTLLVLIIACWALAWTGNVARRGPGTENSSVEEK